MTYEAHPVADLFPMLPDDELKDLAHDIAERGLLHPIVLDAEGRILDGRNRHAACEIASAEPEFVTYEGDDPVGYALTVNGQRRDLTKGQRALIAVRAESFLKKQRGSAARIARTLKVSKTVVSKAAAVNGHDDLADAAMSGTIPLNDAYETARRRKRDAESDERKLAELRAEAPDLADQVVEDTLPLGEAIAALRERQRKAADDRRDSRELLTRIVDLAAPPSMSDGFVDSWASQLGDVDDQLADLTKRAEQAAQVLLDLVDRIRQ